MAKITLDEIIDAFILQDKPVLKMAEIKKYILNKREDGWDGYKDKYSFDQTIQRIVEDHCLTRSGNRGKSVFISVARSFYRLEDDQFLVHSEKFRDPDNIIKLNANSNDEDLEQTTRYRVELNIINRNKELVIGLKKLYDNKCQLCETKLQISENKFYSEVHHIKSLGKPHDGPDKSTNMIVVCPNCHVLLDFKARRISKQEIICKYPHTLDDIYIDYHNQECE